MFLHKTLIEVGFEWLARRHVMKEFQRYKVFDNILSDSNLAKTEHFTRNKQFLRNGVERVFRQHSAQASRTTCETKKMPDRHDSMRSYHAETCPCVLQTTRMEVMMMMI